MPERDGERGHAGDPEDEGVGIVEAGRRNAVCFEPAAGAFVEVVLFIEAEEDEACASGEPVAPDGRARAPARSCEERDGARRQQRKVGGEVVAQFHCGLDGVGSSRSIPARSILRVSGRTPVERGAC
ncbi:MAG: hypothetical protein ACR2HN_13585 [Tepidiformaceae bacterium]